MRKKKTTPWARRRRRVYIGCVLVALLLAPAVVWRLRLKSDLRGEISALRTAGAPTTAEELEAWVSQFPRPASVPEFEEVFSGAWVGIPFEVSQNFPSFRSRHEGADLGSVPYGAETLDAMRQTVSQNEERLRHLREARRAWEPGRSANVHTHTAEEMVEICCANACVKAADGDGAGAAEAVLDGLALLKASNTTRWSESLWHPRDAVEKLMRALASAAARATLPEAPLREMQSLLAAPNWMEEVKLSNIYNLATMVREFPSRQLDSPEARAADIIFGNFDRYMYYSIRSGRARLELIGKSVGEQQAVFDELKERRERRDFSLSAPPMHLAVAAAGIEVMCYFQSNGKLPESLEVFARDGLDLQDFFSGKSLGYKPDGNSFVIYSVGRDLKDDGGSGRDDIAFRATLWAVP